MRGRTYAALYGDTSGSHGVYSCRLESKVDEQTEPEGLWSWYDGGSLWWWTYQHNVTLCAVAAPWSDDYTLVLAVQPDQVQRGIAVRNVLSRLAQATRAESDHDFRVSTV